MIEATERRSDCHSVPALGASDRDSLSTSDRVAAFACMDSIKPRVYS